MAKDKVENTGDGAENPKKDNLETRVSYLERIVARLKNIAEVHRGEDIDGDGKIGNIKLRFLGAIALLCMAFGIAKAADSWVLYDGDSTYGTAKITAASGVATLTVNSMDVSGDYILANDETIDNATDGAVRITYDDDAATLGTLKLESDNAAANMADNDLFAIQGIANDSGGTKTVYSEIDLRADDVTDTTEDGGILLKAFVAGTSRTLATIGAATTIGAAQATLALTSSDWAIDATGIGTGLGNLTSDGTVQAEQLTSTDDALITDDLTVSGKVTIVETADITGVSTLRGAVNIAGAVAITNNLSVSTNLTVTANVDVNGSSDFAGAVAIAGAVTITNNLTVSTNVDAAAYTADAGAGLDTQSAGALKIGESTATSVEIADTGVQTDIQGTLSVDEAATFDAAVTVSGKLLDATAGGTATAAQGTVAKYMGAVHYDVITWTNTSAVFTFTDGSDEGESAEIFTFPEGRIYIMSAACNFTTSCDTNFEANPNDEFFVSVGTAAAGDDATLTGTEADIIASQTLDTTGDTVHSFEVEADMTAGADTVFDGTASAVKLYFNGAVANTSISNNVAVTNAGTIQIIWAFLGDD